MCNHHYYLDPTPTHPPACSRILSSESSLDYGIGISHTQPTQPPNKLCTALTLVLTLIVTTTPTPQLYAEYHRAAQLEFLSHMVSTQGPHR